MLATDLARALNPEIFAWDAGVNLDPWQKALMIERPRRSLQLCCRQAGKSTVTALAALWTAIYEAPALILLVSPSQRQSAELFRTVMLYHNALAGAPALSMESVLRAEFQNGSRILALPGTEKTVRGYSKADLIVIDEAARVEDALISAVRPMLATSELAGSGLYQHQMGSGGGSTRLGPPMTTPGTEQRLRRKTARAYPRPSSPRSSSSSER